MEAGPFGAPERPLAAGRGLGRRLVGHLAEELIEPHGIGPWRPFHAVEGPVEAYEANGWLGQYIVIIPKADLVAVRQIESRETHIPSDNYPDFVERVQALGDAIGRAEGGE